MCAMLNRDWRYQRQEHFQLPANRLIPYVFSGNDYLVYDNVNLSIFVDDDCNGDCEFCVARMRYENDGRTYCKPKLDTEAYLQRLRQVMQRVQGLNPSLSITGGEPSISRRLPAILDVLQNFKLRKKTITTNGSGLFNKIPGGENLLQRLQRFGLAHLNVSRAHHDEARNEQIMKMKGSGLTNSQLAQALEQARRAGIRPRLSCVLLKNEIESLQDIMDYAAWAESLQVDNIVFRQLMQYDPAKVMSCPASQFCDANSVDLLPLWEKMDADARFVFENQVLGYYYYVEVFKYRGIDLVSEAADLAQIPSSRERILAQTAGRPVVYEMVFHPNGSLCGSWREWEEVLDA